MHTPIIYIMENISRKIIKCLTELCRRNRPAAVCCAVVLPCAVLLLLPPMQGLAIACAESLLSRALDHPHWHRELCIYALLLLLGLCLALPCMLLPGAYRHAGDGAGRRRLDLLYAAELLILLVCAQPSVYAAALESNAFPLDGRDTVILFLLLRAGLLCTALVLAWIRRDSLSSRILRPGAEVLRGLCGRGSLRVFLCCAAFLGCCYFPMLMARSGMSPTDTERLFLTGNTDGFMVQVRYVSMFLLKALSFSDTVYNSTPLMQVLGIFELAAVMVVLRHVCAEGRGPLLGLLAALPAVLSPWFAQNMGYVHDACFHPLAMLMGIAPFLFCGDTVLFVVASVVCNYFMCLTYQLASGVYIVMALYCALWQYLRGRRSLGGTFAFVGVAALSYLAPLGFYEFGLFYSRPWNDYATAVLPESAGIVQVLLRNIRDYLSYLRADMGKGVFAAVYAIVAAGGLLACILRTRASRIVSALLAVAVFAAGLVLSFGVSLVLEKPLWNPRAFIGIGVFASMQAYSFIALREKGAFRRTVPAVMALCSFSLVLFACTHGAAMYQQRLFEESRMECLVADLNSLRVPFGEAKFQVDGSVGHAPTVQLAAETWPLLHRLVYVRMSGAPTVYLLALRGLCEPRPYVDFGGMDFPLLKDTSFYAIYGNGILFRIVLKGS